MSLTGGARRDGVPLESGEKLGSRSLLELDAGSTLRLAHTASARQWTVTGPARFVACDAGAEEIAIASGALALEPSTGVRPGAEVWLGTPFGSLRYSDARGAVVVSANSLELRVASGQLWFTPLGESANERVLAAPGSAGSGGAASHALFSADLYRPSHEQALSRCARDAERAEQQARAVLAPSDEALGARAAKHVRARQQAHASCVSAFASLLAAEPGAALSRSAPAAAGASVETHSDTPGGDAPTGGGPAAALSASPATASPRWAELARYDQMWRRVPDPASAPRQ